MKCPYCDHALKATDIYCPACKQPLPDLPEEGAPIESVYFIDRWYVRLALFVVGAIIAVFVLGFGIYKLYFWRQDYAIARLYSRGERTPVVNQILLDDGRTAHALSFFANDGDQIYIPELGISTIVSGNVARVEIPDSDWFSGDLENIESAIVRLSPLIIAEGGERTQLPTLEMTVDPPQSPIEVRSPAKDGVTVFTSVYPLEVKVVPGSTVIVNGEDVTDITDRNGLLSANVNIYPVGDNIITLLVRTPNHLETRRDVKIYRAQTDIEVELSSTSVKTVSESRKMEVAGICEPGAMIVVDSPHVAESVYIDMQTGSFKFLTDFKTIGENIVRFRVTMPGRNDAEVYFAVKYRPTFQNYEKAAWVMDYAGLRRMYATWTGRVFKCVGTVTDVFNDGDAQYIVMDVSNAGEEAKPIVLINESSTDAPVIGSKYRAYAHVEGRYMYKAQYYPMLTTLYMDLTK